MDWLFPVFYVFCKQTLKWNALIVTLCPCLHVTKTYTVYSVKDILKWSNLTQNQFIYQSINKLSLSVNSTSCPPFNNSCFSLFLQLSHHSSHRTGRISSWGFSLPRTLASQQISWSGSDFWDASWWPFCCIWGARAVCWWHHHVCREGWKAYCSKQSRRNNWIRVLMNAYLSKKGKYWFYISFCDLQQVTSFTPKASETRPFLDISTMV